MASKTTPIDTVEIPKMQVAGKVRTKGAAGSTSKGDTISRTNDRYTANRQSSAVSRARTSVNKIIQELSQQDGIFSSAVNAMVTLAVNKGFKVAGYNAEGVMDLEIMNAAYVVLDRLDGATDYEGYSDTQSLREVINSMTIDVITTGGCGVEMVLDDQYIQQRLSPISYSTIEWVAKDDNGSRYPKQTDNDNDLDVPTVFIAEHMRNPNSAYAMSMLRPGIEMTFMYSEFLEDMRRVLRQTGSPRILAKLVTEKVVDSIPKAIKDDPVKFKDWMTSVYSEVSTALKGMEPEDAAIFWDSVDIQIAQSTGEKADYATLLKTMANMFGTSVKSPASALGLRVDGSQGLSNSETLIYMKTVGAVPYTVCTALSRALTLGVRLLGYEGSVKLSPSPVELRPDGEMQAYVAAKQAYVLKQWSLGLINGAQVCYELDLRPNMLVEELAGTRFDDASSSTSGAADANDPDRVNSAEASLNPGTPTKSGGADQ